MNRTPRRIPTYQRRASLETYRRQRLEQRQATPLQQFVRSRSAGSQTLSRVTINEETAMRISAAFCAVRIRSGLLSTLPVDVMERRGTGVKDAKVGDHPAAWFLQQEPNSYQVPAVFMEQTEAHLCLWGNSFTEITFDLDTAEVASGVNHHPACVDPFFDDQDRGQDGRPKLKYRIQSAGGHRIVDRSQMVHIPGFGFNGITGLSVLGNAAESFGIAASGDRLAAAFNGNAAKPFLVVTSPDYLDDDAFNRLSREIREEYTEDNAFGSLLLEGGAQAAPMTLPLRDVQFLESRKFQGEEIAARWFGLPPHLAGYLDRAHFNNVEEQDRALLVFTLAPLLVRREQEFNRKLFTRQDRQRYYTKFNVDALLRGQLKERYEAHKSALQAGWKTINEVREKEDLPALPGGDELPRPAAIWGKDQTDAQQSQADSDNAQRTDPRLQALVVSTLTGLQNAERIQAERWATRPDAETRLRDWYDGHVSKALDKLQSLDPDPTTVVSALQDHRDQLLQAVRASDPAAAVEACVAGWRNDPARLAGCLIDPEPKGGA